MEKNTRSIQRGLVNFNIHFKDVKLKASAEKRSEYRIGQRVKVRKHVSATNVCDCNVISLLCFRLFKIVRSALTLNFRVSFVKRR